MIEVSWDNRTAYDDDDKDDFNIERSTEVARAVLLGSSEDFCGSARIRLWQIWTLLHWASPSPTMSERGSPMTEPVPLRRSSAWPSRSRRILPLTKC